jgi:hypothetical protein
MWRYGIRQLISVHHSIQKRHSKVLQDAKNCFFKFKGTKPVKKIF